MHRLTLEHETTIKGDTAIIDIFADVAWDVDAWVVELLGVAPSLTQAEQDGLKARFIVEVEKENAQREREFIIDQGLQARDYAAF